MQFRRLLKTIKILNTAQFEVIDRLGAEGLLSIREKQTHWGTTKASWPVRKLYYLLGKLHLNYSPKANLEEIKEYIAKKKE